jgi:hypothetical protein
MSTVKFAYRVLTDLGLDPRQSLRNYRYLWRLMSDYRSFKSAWSHEKERMPLSLTYPVLRDYAAGAGSFGGHYFHMDMWVARRIFKAAPARHIDVGSRIDGFLTHLLVFRDVEVIDIRPVQAYVKGLSFIQEDATKMQRFESNSLASLSSLHVAEHFGLGRYGDPIDPNACWQFMKSLARVLAPGGTLYFAVPVGRERIEFNAHRIFDPRRIIRFFGEQGLQVVACSAVDDRGDFVETPDWEIIASNEFSCGIFEFTKRVSD